MLSSRLFRSFQESVTQEVGADNLQTILVKSPLSPTFLEVGSQVPLNGSEAARVYALLQQALRLYYGRGAHGILLRIGQGMWKRMIAKASLLEKAELEIAREVQNQLYPKTVPSAPGLES